MGAVTNTAVLDDELGPAEGRYFGQGYRQVSHTLRDPTVEESDAPRDCSWTGEVAYPERWSVNPDGSSRTPHLSSIDAIVLGLLALQSVRQVSEGSLAFGECDVLQVELHSGSTPWWDLKAVPVTLALSPSTPAGWSGEFVSALVGNIRVRMSVSDPHWPLPRDLSTVGVSLGAKGEKTAVSRPVIWTTTVQFDPSTSVLMATHAVRNDPNMAGKVTVTSSNRWALEMPIIHYLVTLGQLTQALVYRAGETRREKVENLWMRSLRITLPNPVSTSFAFAGAEFTTTTRIVKESALKVNGRLLRCLQVASETSDGVVAAASVAYFEEAVE
ncbi:AvrD family protein [Paenarthrobacter sp. NPDC091669]|uniref:AvrD family protein n=1 Tax=Paenarthrobacter sp. NPDC091669 TaxID=3364384 RepID=UPI0038080E6E